MKKYFLLTMLSAIIFLQLHAQNIYTKMHEPWKYSVSELKQQVYKISQREKKEQDKKERNNVSEEEESDESLKEIMNPLLYDFELHENKDGRLTNFSSATWNAYYDYINKHPSVLSEEGNGDWSFLGPKKVTGGEFGIGRVNSIKIISADTWLAGGAGGGLWKTTNGGSSWKCLTDGLPDIAVSDIAVDPDNSNVIYILTGDGDWSKFPSIGVLKTTDGGSTWKTTGLTWGLNDVVYGHKLIIDPANSQILWAATTKGIYRTSNGGSSWTQINSGEVKPNTEYYDIEFKPGHSNYIYACTKNEICYNTNYPTNSFIKSTVSASSSCIRVELTVTPADANYVYAIFVNKSKGLDGVYQSVNSGTSFTQQCDDNPDYLGRTYPYPPSDGGQGGYDLVLLANPSNKNEVFLAGIHLFRSTNHAQTFKRIDSTSGPTFVHGDYHWAVWNGDDIVVGSDGGIWESNSNFTAFTNKINGLGITQYYHMGVDPFNANNFGGGAQDNGTLLTTNNNTAFDHAIKGDGMEVIYYPGQQNVVAASEQTANVLISTDGGSSFTSNRPDKDADAEFNAPLILNADNKFFSSVEGALYQGVFVFSQIIWTKIQEKDGMVFHQCSQLASAASNTNRFYAMYHLNGSGYLLRCDNMNSSSPDFYTPNTTDYSSQFSHSSGMDVDPDDATHLYVTFSGYGVSQHVWESNNGGTTFHNFSGSLPDVPVYCVKADGSAKHGVYIGTELGVFFRNDDTKDWIFYSDGMPVVQVRELFIVPLLFQLRAATYGRGIWASPLYAGCTQNITLTKNDYSKGDDYEQASNNIISTENIPGSVGDSVTYNAGNFVRLDTGFECKSGGELYAFIKGCNVAGKQERTGIYAGSLSAIDTANNKFELGNNAANNTNRILLSQNVPNPFSNSTTISYSIPQQFSSAKIIVTDKNGNALKQINLSNNKGNVTVDAATLSSGAYQYSLYVDGRLIDTKQMIINK
jgi:hypothetical protein